MEKAIASSKHVGPPSEGYELFSRIQCSISRTLTSVNFHVKGLHSQYTVGQNSVLVDI